MKQQDTYIALDWLKPALDETCALVISKLADIADTGDRSLLSEVTELIHQISGTLKLTELNEFLVLSETLEEFSCFLQRPNCSANDVRDLLQATTVLRFELNALHGSKRNHSGLLYQRANYLREIMQKPRLGSDSLHAINLQQVLPQTSVVSEALDDEGLNTLNQAWRKHTLSLINEDNDAFEQLGRTAEFLQKGATTIPQSAVWHVAIQWLASLQMNKPIKIGDYIHVLTDLNECILSLKDAQKAETVIVDMLIQLLGMDNVVEEANVLMSQISSVSNQKKSSRIFDSVTSELEFALSQFEEKPQKTIQKLTEATWLLEVGGWQLYHQFMQQIIDDLRNHNINADNQESVWKIKRQLTELHTAILKTKQLLGHKDDINNSMVSEAKNAVLREARIDIEKIKTQFNAYSVSKRFEDLADVPGLFEGVVGAFKMLELQRAIDLTNRLQRLFDNVLRSDELEVLSWPEIDAIAEAISSLEYYFDLLAQHYHDEDILDRAESGIKKAEGLLNKNLAAPLTMSSLVDREKVLAKNVIHYDDSGEVMSTKSSNEIVENNESNALSQEGNQESFSTVNEDDFNIDLDDLGDFTGGTEQEAPEASSQGTVVDEETTDLRVDILHDEMLVQFELATSAELQKAELLLNDDDLTLDEEIREIYIEEADEVLEHMNRYFPLWKADPQDLAPLTEVRRGFHTLKGSGRMVGANQAGEVAWAAENMLNRVLEKGLQPTAEVVNYVDAVMQMMPHYVADFSEKRSPRYNPVVPIVRAHNLIANKALNSGLTRESDEVKADQNDKDAAQEATQIIANEDVVNTFDQVDGLLDASMEIGNTVDGDFNFDDFDNIDLSESVVNDSGVHVVVNDALNASVIDEPDDELVVDTTTASTTDSTEQSEITKAQTADVQENSKITEELQHWMSTVVPPISDDLNTSDDIKEIFVEEADEVLAHIANKMQDWRENRADKVALTDIRRGFHTLKGSGRMVGANQAGELAWSIEDMLNRVIDDAIPATDDLVAVVDAVTDVMPEMVKNYEQGQPNTVDIIPLIALAKSHVQKAGMHPAEAVALSQGKVLGSQTDNVDSSNTVIDSNEQVVEATHEPKVDVMLSNEPEDTLVISEDRLDSSIESESESVVQVNDVETTGTHIVADNALSTGLDSVSFDLDGFEDEPDNELDTLSAKQPQSMLKSSSLSDDLSDDFDFDLPEIDEPVVNSISHDTADTLHAEVSSLETTQQTGDAEKVDTLVNADIEEPNQGINSDDSFRDVFIEEADGILQQLKTFVEENPNGGEVTNDIVRALHTLRGSAAMSGLDVLRDINHSMELAFRHLLDNRMDLDVDHIALLSDACEQSRHHIQNYKDGHETEATQADIDLINQIKDMTTLDEEIYSDPVKVHVSDLVELDIDDLLDAEWELEKQLLSDEAPEYVVSMLEQIDRLYSRVSHIPNLSDVLGRLNEIYQHVHYQPALVQEDRIIDVLLKGHQSITTMFDAMAASQRVMCEPSLLTSFYEITSWIENEKLAVMDDDFDSDLASIDAALAAVHGESDATHAVTNSQEDDTEVTSHDDSVPVVLDDVDEIAETAELSDEVIDDLVAEVATSSLDNELLTDDISEDSHVVSDDKQSVLNETSSEGIDTPDNADTRRYETNFESDLLSIFMEEAEEISLEIDSNMNAWAANPKDTSVLAELQRHLHTIKGGARMVGLSSIGDLTHEAETVYELLVAQKIEASPALVRFMRHVQDVVAQQVDELNANNRSFYADKELDAIQAFVGDADENKLSLFFDSEQLKGSSEDKKDAKADVVEADAVETNDTDVEPSATSDSPVAMLQNDISADNEARHEAAIDTDHTNEQQQAHESETVTDTNKLNIAAVPLSVDATVEIVDWQEDSKPDPEMLEIFLEEAGEIVETSSNLLYEWTNNVTDTEKLHALQRELHTLKGGARMAGVSSLGDLAHEMEFIYEDYAQGKKEPHAEIIKVLSQSHDWLAEAVTVLNAGQNPGSPDSLIAPLQSYMSDTERFSLANFANNANVADLSSQSDAKEVTETDAEQREKVAAKSAELVEPMLKPDAKPVQSAEVNVLHTDVQSENESSQLKDLLHQQGEKQTVAHVDLPSMNGEFGSGDNQQSSSEMIRISASLMEKMINLSGEAAINRGRVEVSNTSLGNTIDEMGATVQRLSDQLRRMDIELEAQILAQYEGEISQYEDFDPLEMDQYSALNQLSKSLAESSSDLLDFKSTMLDKVRETEGLLLQQSRIQTELQEGLMNSRLVPFSRLNSRLQRIIRQTANELGKSAELHIINSDSELDRTILDRITSPLEHMLRNAVDHGVEMPSERKAAGKSETGNIQLSVKREGGEIVITVTDDGKGINVDAVRRKAEQRGLIQNQELSDNDIMQYVFHAGLSTATSVTQISGRGVGMDVVQSEIKQLGGVISVDSTQGKGSVFTMRLPLTVAMTDALVVRSADRHYAIPLVQIDRIERVSFDDIKAYYRSDKTTINIGGVEYRLRYLNTLLNGAPFSDFNQISGVSVPIIVVKTASGPKQAIQIDELSGSRTEIVVKPLGNQLAKTQGVSAATILGDGSVMLILDMLALIRQAPAEKQVWSADEEVADVAVTNDKTHVMVVDDSVTVRKVTTRLLERNGFVVTTAKDGVDAIEKLQEITPDVMLLDIEMPRMDGFEVASQVRNNPRLRDVPIIMITSRTGEKHRERAFEIGVNCYMGKPFQEKELLENIDELMNPVLIDV